MVFGVLAKYIEIIGQFFFLCALSCFVYGCLGSPLCCGLEMAFI